MLDDKGDWYWRGERWQAQRTPDWLPWGVLLVLRNRRGQRWRLAAARQHAARRVRALRARCFAGWRDAALKQRGGFGQNLFAPLLDALFAQLKLINVVERQTDKLLTIGGQWFYW